MCTENFHFHKKVTNFGKSLVASSLTCPLKIPCQWKGHHHRYFSSVWWGFQQSDWKVVVRWGGDGYLRPDQFLDHLTVIKTEHMGKQLRTWENSWEHRKTAETSENSWVHWKTAEYIGKQLRTSANIWEDRKTAENIKKQLRTSENIQNHLISS